MYDMAMMEGPSIEGKWYNKRTGKTITVKDMMMSDEGMQIFTTDNQLIDGDDFSRDYIQCDDTVYDTNGNSTGTTESIDYESMFGSIGSDSQPFDNTPIYNDNKTTVVEQPAVETLLVNKKFDTLDSLFSKLDKLPDVNCSISWKKIPKSELKMLKTYFDITDEDIAEYVYTKYCTPETIKASIKEAITKLIAEKEK